MKIEDNTHYVDVSTPEFTSGSVVRRAKSELLDTHTLTDYYSTGAVCGEMALLTHHSHDIKLTCQTGVQVCEIFLFYLLYLSIN